MRRLVVYSAAIAIGLGALISGQTPQVSAPVPGQPATQLPTRAGRPGEPPPKGTAIIRGYVVAADTGQPLRKAQVSARSMNPGGGGGSSSTDAEGRFEIKELPAGRYNLTASKGVYVTLQYGARRPGDQGTPLEMSDGQLAEKVNFSLIRGGVIAGRIVDDAGDPMPGVNVTAQRFAFMAGSRRLMPSGNGDRTDDTGAYRLYGLPAGEYYVNATGGFGILSGGSITISTSMMSTTETDGYAPTYYPGTPNISEAQRVSVKAGQELTAVHFALMSARLSKVRGRVLNSRGEPGRGMVMLLPSDPFGMVSFGPNSTTQLAADGSFQLSGVAPGRYNLNVRPMAMPGPDQEFAAMQITVGSEDLDNVMLTMSVGATVSGVIQTDDGSPPPFRADEVQVFASAPDPMTMALGGGPPKINPDYTFELSSLADRRIVRASVNNQATWLLKAVIFDGTDVTDSGIEFTPGRSYEGLQIVFTQKATDLSGLVTDSRGRAVTDATVVIFPANREKWTTQSRFMRTARPDTQGRYNFKGLPPYDDYVIIAVQNLENGQGADPDFLARAREEAKSVGLTEGEKKAFDVKLSSLVP